MKRKNITINRTISIVLSVPMDETQEQTEQWVDNNICSLEQVDADHIIKDVRLSTNDDDQDNFLVVEWPESQELMEHEGFMDNCTLLLNDGFGGASYLVRRDWYARLQSDELKLAAA